MNETEIILLDKVKEQGVVRIIMDYKNDLESIEYFIIQWVDSIIREVTDVHFE